MLLLSELRSWESQGFVVDKKIQNIQSCLMCPDHSHAERRHSAREGESEKGKAFRSLDRHPGYHTVSAEFGLMAHFCFSTLDPNLKHPYRLQVHRLFDVLELWQTGVSENQGP